MAGTIVTFYSYKGGTGRTMAISNVAWILASNGYRVLLIDWDLESPGLHRYLRPFLTDPELTSTRGLIDFLSDAVAPTDSAGTWFRWRKHRIQSGKLAPVEDYTVGVNWTFRSGGSIVLLPAGKQDQYYAQRVNSFNWNNFYARLGGDKLLEEMRGTLRANYDYVLIDSRTGVGDTCSICTMRMPDLLVVLFTLNRQSIHGTAAVASLIRASRGEGLPIFPVPTRIEYGEDEKLDAAKAYARHIFAPFLLHVQSDRRVIDPAKQATYWNDVETPYISFYAFEEILAALKDDPGSRRGLLAPNERIASWITDEGVSLLYPEEPERRRELVDAYAFKLNDVSALDWMPPKRAGWSAFFRMRGTLIRMRGRVGRQRWRLAAIVFAGVIVLLSVWIVSLESRLKRPDLPFRLGGVYVGQLLKGAKPADLPVRRDDRQY